MRVRSRVTTQATLYLCPVCTSNRHAPIAEGIKRCRFCGCAFNTGYAPHTYHDAYFNEEYRAQYGRTYLEDRDAIYALSSRRLSAIIHLGFRQVPLETLSILDIGSAAGFFLECARDRGIGKVQGVEISSYAADYCRDNLGIPVIQGSFPAIPIHGTYHIITCWYFLEHCEDPVTILRKIYRLLNKGGVFACSVPSIFGPLYLLHRNEWIKHHPADHRVDFTPHSLRLLVKNTGFRHIRLAPSGIHPERIIKKSHPLFRPFASCYRLFSRLACFSDTLEAYALK